MRQHVLKMINFADETGVVMKKRYEMYLQPLMKLRV